MTTGARSISAGYSKTVVARLLHSKAAAGLAIGSAHPAVSREIDPGA